MYARNPDLEYVERLWTVLRDPATVARLPEVAKTYGAGAMKVEPRALEQLPLPADLLRTLGLPRGVLGLGARLYHAYHHARPVERRGTRGTCGSLR